MLVGSKPDVKFRVSFNVENCPVLSLVGQDHCQSDSDYPVFTYASLEYGSLLTGTVQNG